MPLREAPINAAVPANAAYLLVGEAFGVRQLAAAYKGTLEKQTL